MFDFITNDIKFFGAILAAAFIKVASSPKRPLFESLLGMLTGALVAITGTQTVLDYFNMGEGPKLIVAVCLTFVGEGLVKILVGFSNSPLEYIKMYRNNK